MSVCYHLPSSSFDDHHRIKEGAMVTILVIVGVFALFSGKILLAILLFVAAAMISKCKKEHRPPS